MFNPILASLSLCILLSSLGTSIANVALPTLAGTFHASFQQVQWVVLAYLLATTALIVSLGQLGDILGRRRLLLTGIGLFTLSSVLCGLAPTLGMLIVARALQGIGAAIMMALSVALVAETVPPQKIGSAMGVLGTMSALGTMLGPSLGGLLISSLGWRALFLCNAPPTLLALFLAYGYLPDDPPKRHTRFDLMGTCWLALTLTAYALGPLNPALLLIAAVGVVFLLRAERRAESPLLRLEMFRSLAVSAGFFMSMLVTTVVMATLVVGPFYLSGVLALDARQVGMVMASGPIVAALTGIPAGRLVDLLGAQATTIAGLLAMLLGSASLPMLSRCGVAGYVVPLMFITAGYALFQAANNTTVMRSAQADQRGVLSGLLSLSRNFGLITGVSVMGTMFARFGLSATFSVAVGLILVAVAIASTLALKATRRTFWRVCRS